MSVLRKELCPTQNVSQLCGTDGRSKGDPQSRSRWKIGRDPAWGFHDVLQQKENIAQYRVRARSHLRTTHGLSAHRLAKVAWTTCAPFTVVLAFSILLTIISALYQPARGPGDLQKLRWQSLDSLFKIRYRRQSDYR